MVETATRTKVRLTLYENAAVVEPLGSAPWYAVPTKGRTSPVALAERLCRELGWEIGEIDHKQGKLELPGRTRP